MDLQEYESHAESMTEELMREELLTGTGQKDTYEISGIYERYSGLFDRDEVRNRLGDRQDARRTNLAAFAVQGHIGRQVRELSETIVNSEMNCRVCYGDEEIPYREAPVRVQNEQDTQARQGWDDAFTAAMAGLNPLYARYWSQTYELTAAMGFASYRQMCDTLVGLRLEWLKESAESILAEIVPMSFRFKLFKCFLDAAVSEQVARMLAMKAATENADQIIAHLTMTYNRARQGQITNELLEVISGAEAQNK